MSRRRIDAGIAAGKVITFMPEGDLAEALNAFMSSNGYSVSEGMRFLLRAALALDPSSIAPEIERIRAYRDTEQWVRERVAASFREISALLEQQSRELRAMNSEVEKPPFTFDNQG